MGGPPGVDQKHLLPRALQRARRAGAEHAGADDDRVGAAGRRRAPGVDGRGDAPPPLPP